MGRAAFSTFSVDRAERISPPIFWLNFQFSSLVTRFKLNMKFLVMLFWIFKYFLNTKAVRWMSKDVKSISHNRTHMCIKGQMKSDCIYEIIDFPKYHRKKLTDFCPKIFFFFNRHYSLLSFRLPQRILIHINSEALPITYSVCCVFCRISWQTLQPITLCCLCSAEGISFT